MARKTADLAAAKQRKRKIAAIAGAVLLVGLLAIQVPRTMKMLDRPDSVSPAAAEAADEESQPTSPPRIASVGATNDFAVVERELASSRRLVSLGRFSRKDPFSPQIRESAGSTGSKPAKANRTSAPKAKAAKKVAAKGKRGGGAQPSKPAPRATVTATAAVISVNGVGEPVKVGENFPERDKVFTLVSLQARAAKIGVAGGSLVGGSETVTLERGKTLTLMNTADGARYELRLVSVG
jgi:hypothetical protein